MCYKAQRILHKRPETTGLSTSHRQGGQRFAPDGVQVTGKEVRDLLLMVSRWPQSSAVSERPRQGNLVEYVPLRGLPILQGGPFRFVSPALAMLSLSAWKCSEATFNASQVNTSSPEFTEEWQKRIREYLKNVAVPVPVYGRERKWNISKFYLFQVFPVLLALCILWLLCLVVTVTKALPTDPTAYGYLGRTDTKAKVLSQAPCRGISWMVESVGDYYTCARLMWASPPQKHAINRGIGIEGIVCLLAGAWGSGNSTTSYRQNIWVLGITEVGSRMVMVTPGCVLLMIGVFGKIGTSFATIPTPVIRGMFLVKFGTITALGISNLQYVDMNSSRNTFVFGFSIFYGIAISKWVNRNAEMLHTGILQLDQVIQVLLTMDMFVGGFLGFLLDNTIPEERGLLAEDQIQEVSEETLKASEVYSLRCGIGTNFCTSSHTRYLPFWPRLEHDRKAGKERHWESL
ncbi:hypothetical protein HPG69_019394 [Diceros bicornis minor]|uniref:Uncharacterized protein n=1 Tax=Diceros bicornis minor TaxID=77932 RepID=A0A7J7E9F3_DICBM|nr:hypothetical protein HPG69_019394 [Diceros bicornis minor]